MTGENSLYLMLSTTHMWEMTESGFLLLFLNVCMHGARAFNMLRFLKYIQDYGMECRTAAC